MTSSPQTPSDLFAAKGRAMPACSKPLAGPPAKAPAAAPKPDRTEATRDDGPASVLSIDLRRALVPARNESPRTDPPQAGSIGIAASARVEPAPASGARHRPPPTPQGHGMAGPFIGALVAVSIAAGVFYIVERGHIGATPDPDAAAAASVKTAPAEEPARASRAAASQAEAGTLPQQAPAGDGDAEAAADDASLPSFDLVRVEPDGSAVIAGRAAPHADLILLHNGEPIGKVRADWAGEWAFVSDKPLAADRHQITILVNEPDAKITLPEGAAPPAQVSGTLNSQPR